MEKELLNAVDDLSLIKNIIEKTRKSFIGLSSIFTKWGVLFALYSVLSFIQQLDLNKTIKFYDNYPYLMFAAPLLLVVIAYLLYRQTIKNKALIGLEKPLLVLWVLVLLMMSLPGRIEIISDTAPLETIQIVTNNISATIFGLGLCMIMTSIFTEIKKLNIIGIAYIMFASVYAFFNLNVLRSIIPLLQYTILPITLFATGIYLKKQGVRNGHQLDS